MSQIENREEWIKAAWDNFYDAAKSGDVALSKAIIADVQEAGFLEDGRRMNQMLRKLITGFTHNVILFITEKRDKYLKEGMIPTLDLLIDDLGEEMKGLLK